ncbi:hypothetical protein HN51_039559, partial [Arachis hypogaea]
MDECRRFQVTMKDNKNPNPNSRQSESETSSASFVSCLVVCYLSHYCRMYGMRDSDAKPILFCHRPFSWCVSIGE